MAQMSNTKVQIQLQNNKDGHYEFLDEKGSLNNTTEARKLRAEANSHNETNQSNNESLAQATRYTTYVHKTLRPLLTKVSANFNTDDFVSYRALIDQQLEREYQLGEVRVQLRQEPKISQWKSELLKLFEGYSNTNELNKVYHVVFEALSPKNQANFELLYGKEVKSHENSPKDFKEFVDQMADHEVLAAKAVLVSLDEEKNYYNNQLKNGITKFITEEANKKKCQKSLVQDLTGLTPHSLELCPEFRALKPETKTKFKQELQKQHEDSGWLVEFVSRLDDDNLIDASVAHENEARLLTALLAIRTKQQVTISPELDALGYKAKDFRDLLEKTFGQKGEVANFVAGLDPAKFAKFFAENKKEFKEELTKILLHGDATNSPEYDALEEKVKSTVAGIKQQRSHDQHTITRLFVDGTKNKPGISDEQLQIYVTKNNARCKESLLDFLANTESKSGEQREILALATHQKLSGWHILNQHLLESDLTTRREKIREFMDTLSPLDLAKLYKARLTHYLQHLEAVSSDQMQFSLELNALSIDQRRAFDSILNNLVETQQNQIKEVAASLNDNQLKELYKINLVRKLSEQEVRKGTLLSDLIKFGFDGKKLIEIHEAYQEQVKDFVSTVDANSFNRVNRVFAKRAEFAEAQKTSVFGFEHATLTQLATLMATVADPSEIENHSVVLPLPASERQKICTKWKLALSQRAKVPRTMKELAQPEYKEHDFYEMDDSTGDQVFSVRGKLKYSDQARGNYATASSELVDANLETLEKASGFIMRRAADLMEAEVKDQKDGATVDFSTCWINQDGTVRTLNASVGGDIRSYVARINETTGEVFLKPITGQLNTLDTRLTGERSDATRQILGKVKIARQNSAQTGLYSLGYQNLREENGQLILMAPNKANNGAGLEVTRAFGHAVYKNDEMENEDTIVISPEATVMNATPFQNVDLEKEKVVIIQHTRECNLSPEQIIDAIKKQHPKKGDAKSESETKEVDKFKIVGNDLLNLAADQGRHGGLAGNMTLRFIPIKDKEKPVCAVLAQGQFGDKTARIIEEKALTKVKQALNEANDNELEKEFKRLDLVVLKDLSGNQAKLGDELRQMWNHANVLEAESKEKLNGSDLCVMKLPPSNKNISELPESKNHVYVLVQPAAENVPTELYFINRSDKIPSITKLGFLQGQDMSTFVKALFKLEEVKNHNYKDQRNLSMNQLHSITSITGHQPKVDGFERRIELYKAAEATRRYVGKTVLVTKQLNVVYADNNQVVPENETAENLRRPKILDLKKDAIYTPKQLDKQLELLEEFREDKLKNFRDIWGILGHYLNKVVQPLRALVVKIKSLGQARAFAATEVRTERDKHAKTIGHMFKQLDQALASGSRRSSKSSNSDKEEKGIGPAVDSLGVTPGDQSLERSSPRV